MRRCAGPPISRTAAPIMLLVAALLLTGCWGVAPMEKTGLVALLGVDSASGDRYRVTVAVINPLGLPTPTGGAANGAPELLRSAVASSTAEAVRRLSATTYLNLDFTHIRGVVVSEQVARAGLAAPLEFMAGSPQFLETPWLYVARGESAAAVLRESQRMMPDAGEVLAGTTAWAQHLFPGYADRLFTFLNQMQTEGDEPATAGVSADAAQGQGPTLAFRLTGTAMFRGDRLVGWLDEPQTLGWLLATGRGQQQTLVAPAPGGGSFTLQILASDHRIRITPGAAGPRADLRVQLRVALVAAEHAPADFWANPAALRIVRASAAGLVTGDIRAALQAAQGVGADVFSLGEHVRVQDPADWYPVRDLWNTSAFGRMPVSIQVRVDVSALGKRFCSLLGPC